MERLTVQLWCFCPQIQSLLEKQVQVQVEPSPFGVGQPFLISATAIDTAIQCDLVGISNFPFQIWILLRKLVQLQIEQSDSENVAQSSPSAPDIVLSVADVLGQIKQFCGQIHDLLKKMGLGTSWTIQIRGGHFSNYWGFVSMSGFWAQLGKVWSWDHQIQNPFEMMHLTIPGSSQFGHIPLVSIYGNLMSQICTNMWLSLRPGGKQPCGQDVGQGVGNGVNQHVNKPWAKTWYNALAKSHFMCLAKLLWAKD